MSENQKYLVIWKMVTKRKPKGEQLNQVCANWKAAEQEMERVRKLPGLITGPTARPYGYGG